MDIICDRQLDPRIEESVVGRVVMEGLCTLGLIAGGTNEIVDPTLINEALITNKIKKRKTPWTTELSVKYTENDLKRCAKDLCVLLQGAEKCSL